MRVDVTVHGPSGTQLGTGTLCDDRPWTRLGRPVLLFARASDPAPQPWQPGDLGVRVRIAGPIQTAPPLIQLRAIAQRAVAERWARDAGWEIIR